MAWRQSILPVATVGLLSLRLSGEPPAARPNTTASTPRLCPVYRHERAARQPVWVGRVGGSAFGSVELFGPAPSSLSAFAFHSSPAPYSSPTRAAAPATTA